MIHASTSPVRLVRIPARPVRMALAIVCAIVALSGCSQSDSGAISAATSTTTVDASKAPTTVVLPEYRSFIATVDASLSNVDIFESPGGEPAMADLNDDGTAEVVTFTNPLPSGAPATMLIKNADQTSPSGELFHEVYLPLRPNSSTGFVRAEDVAVSHTDMAATVDLSDHTLVLSSAGDVIETFTIAAGAPDTPTPTGLFFIKELVEPANEDGAYGPLAYGLSAYSEAVLDTEAFADGVIGIHGTNRPDLLGTDVSHGCVRISNDDVLRLEELAVPLGMPVRIQP